jgi:hypothetical protein
MAKLILTVDHDVMHDPNLELLDKLILSYILNWEEKNLTCFAKDGFFASLFGEKDALVRFSLHKLESLKKIEQISGTGGRLIRSIKKEKTVSPVTAKDIFEV